MNNELYTKEVYSSFGKEIEKVGGEISELVGSVGWFPLPTVIGGVLGAASTKPTKKEIKEQKKKSFSNILLPGVGAYRAARRITHGY